MACPQKHIVALILAAGLAGSLAGCSKSMDEIYKANDAPALRRILDREEAVWDAGLAGEAVTEDKVELADAWLDRFAPELTQLEKDSLLHRAVSYRAPGTTRVLLEHGADPNGLYFSYLPLGQAVSLSAFGQGKPTLPVVKELVEAGAFVNNESRYRRPFVEAAGYADKATVDYLLEKGAFVNSGSGHGTTPMSHAVMFNKPEVVELLVERGGEIVKFHYYGATITDNRDVLSSLARIDPLSAHGLGYALAGVLPDELAPETFRLLLDLGADPNFGGEEILARYVAAGRVEEAELLLEAGARPTVAGVAACARFGNGELLSLLLAKASPEVKAFSEFSQLLTDHQFEKAAGLIKKNRNLLNQKIEGMSLVEWCVKWGDFDSARALLGWGAKSSWEAVHLALEQSVDQQTLKTLVKGLDWNDDSFFAGLAIAKLQSEYGFQESTQTQKTPLTLQQLIEEEKIDELRARLESGVDPNTRLDEGQRSTLLHLAAEQQSESLVDLLLKHGADAAALDIFGLSPAYYAEPRSAIAEKLRNAGAPEQDFELARLIISIRNGVEFKPAEGFPLSGLASRTTPSTDASLEMIAAVLGPEMTEVVKGSKAPLGKKPLAVAFEYGAGETAKNLLEAGAEPGEALSEALGYGEPELLELLVEKGALKSKYALIELSQHFSYRPDLADLALEQGANPNEKGPSGERALVEAADHNELMGLWLLDHGADPALPDSENKYALQESLHNKRYDTLARRLIAEGAPLNKKDHWKRTALDWAALLPSPSLIKLLREKGGEMDKALREEALRDPYLKEALK
jgi:ankyrin repeat protein